MATVSVKAGTTTSIPFRFNNVSDFSKVNRIEFIFKQEEDDDDASALKTALWEAEGECVDATKISDEPVVLVKVWREDTYLFEQGEPFFCDTRITYKDTDENPRTNIVRLRMQNSLFESGEEVTAG